MLERIKKLEESARKNYMSHYRHLHQYPEVGYHEEKTSKYVADYLESIGIEVKRNVGGYGVVGLIKGDKPGGVVALRADMDALSITEKTGLEYASKNEGVMHACGHDAHTSMLLGAAEVLNQMKDGINGSVKLVFQPAEECSPKGGAPLMIENGALENPKVDAMMAMHVWPVAEVGSIGVQHGVVSAASDRLHVSIKGKAAHGAMPETGIDAVVAASATVMAMQSIVSRNMSPQDAVVVTFGTIKGGTADNIIAGEVNIDGTARSFSDEVREELPKLIKRVSENTAQAFGATAEVEYIMGYPTTKNDEKITDILRQAVEDQLGKKGLMPDMPVPPTAEDFSFFSRKVPAAFAWLGCRPVGASDEEFAPIHNERFAPSVDCMPIGVRFLVGGALKILDSLK